MKKFRLLFSVAILATIGVLAPASVATAAEPIYPVMNTSEYPPDGIYWRSAPDWNTPIAVTGHGVVAGDQIRLTCWEYGTNVPRRDGGSNTIWYIADNVSRPTSPRGANTGWINAHFVNDGTGPNQVAPGVIRCGSTPPPPPQPPSPPPVTAVYYSPFETTYQPDGQPAVRNVKKSEWVDPSVQCGTSRAIGYVPSSARTLTGWSIGRLGPSYALARASASQKQQVTYVYMIDPGNYADLSTSCDNRRIQTGGPLDSKRPGQILAEWLGTNPNTRLTIMAGRQTADYAHLINGRAHAGIQNVYFNDIRAKGSNVRSRVTVCTYRYTNHSDMFLQFNTFINRARITSSCPTSATGTRPTAGPWHP